MLFTTEQCPHKNERISILNSYTLALENAMSILCEEIPMLNDYDETGCDEIEDPFGLASLIEKEMEDTFGNLHANLYLATWAIEKVGKKILFEEKLLAIEKKLARIENLLLTRCTGTVYLIGSYGGRILKIGHTKNLEQRLKQLQSGCAHKLEIIKAKTGDFQAEKEELRKARNFRIQGEWFTWDNSIISNF